MTFRSNRSRSAEADEDKDRPPRSSVGRHHPELLRELGYFLEDGPKRVVLPTAPRRAPTGEDRVDRETLPEVK